MEQTTTKRQDRRRRRGLLLLLMAATAIISVTGATLSLALFTDTQQVTGNAFTTGTIDISVAPATAVLTATTMMPGDTVNGSAVVSNAGTAQLRYAVTGIATNTDGLGLASQITITIRELGTSCAAFDGTQLFSGVVGYATTNLIGDPAQGGQAGDRTLNAGSNETLCLRATLPLATGNAYQGATTTMTFTFDAEQTANNP
jgi:predicted ribosomally synthesized peptide with SipW-like signal peptide